MAVVLCKNTFQLLKRELREKKGKMRQKKGCRNSLDKKNSNPKTGISRKCIIIGITTTSSLKNTVSIKYGGNICYKLYSLIWHVKDATDS